MTGRPRPGGGLSWRYRAWTVLYGVWRALTAYGQLWVQPGHPEFAELVLRSGEPPPGHPERRSTATPLNAEERSLKRRMYGEGPRGTDDSHITRKRFRPRP